MSSLQSLDIAKRQTTTATTPVACTHKAVVAKLYHVTNYPG